MSESLDPSALGELPEPRRVPPGAGGIAGLLEALAVRDIGARTKEDIFVGPSEWMPSGRVFGGQVLAQAVAAASLTAPGDRALHSTHGYFLRPGNADLPITFAVDRIHDGRSFSTRRTQAYQQGVPIFSMIASFQEDQAGFDGQISPPADVPSPESVPSQLEQAVADADANAFLHSHRAFDVRPLPLPPGPVSERPLRYAAWMRATAALPDDARLHSAALAYASDYAILTPALQVHGLDWSDPGLKTASLDHAMWWHRPARADEWFLYVIESPSTQGGRGLAKGHIFDVGGRLVATVVQEGMMRWSPTGEPAVDRSASEGATGGDAR